MMIFGTFRGERLTYLAADGPLLVPSANEVAAGTVESFHGHAGACARSPEGIRSFDREGIRGVWRESTYGSAGSGARYRRRTAGNRVIRKCAAGWNCRGD